MGIVKRGIDSTRDITIDTGRHICDSFDDSIKPECYLSLCQHVTYALYTHLKGDPKYLYSNLTGDFSALVPPKYQNDCLRGLFQELGLSGVPLDRVLFACKNYGELFKTSSDCYAFLMKDLSVFTVGDIKEKVALCEHFPEKEKQKCEKINSNVS